MSAAPSLYIRQTSPAGPAVGFGLAGDSQTTRSGGSGSGGWQMVDRPRRAATTEWTDWGPFQLTMSLILDTTLGAGGTSLEPSIAVVESWEVPAPGSSPPLPPRLAVTGPVPHNEVTWVVYSLTWKEAIRDPASGVRWQQNLDIVLWQYLPPSVTAEANLTPLQAWKNAGPAPLPQTYTVKAGETLQTIAAKLYGSAGYWTLLANANGFRSPTVPAGAVLVVPSKTASPPALNPGAALPGYVPGLVVP